METQDPEVEAGLGFRSPEVENLLTEAREWGRCMHSESWEVVGSVWGFEEDKRLLKPGEITNIGVTEAVAGCVAPNTCHTAN